MNQPPIPRFDPRALNAQDSAPLTAAPENDTDVQDVDLRAVGAVLRRRWRWPLVIGILAVTAMAVFEYIEPPSFSAGVLLQKQEPESPLETLDVASPVSRLANDITAEQVAILQSRAILEPVVDSLGLRIWPSKHGLKRTALFQRVVVDKNARDDDYELAMRDGKFTLTKADNDSVVATAPAGGTLRGNGFAITLQPTATLDDELDFSVDPAEKAVRRLRAKVSIQPINNTELIRATYSNTDPVMAAAVVNTLGAVYKGNAADVARAEAVRRRVFIGTQLAQITDTLTNVQSQLLSYQQSSGTLDPKVEGETLIGMLMTAENDLRTLRYNEGILSTLIHALQTPSTDIDDALRRTVVLGHDLIPAVDDMYGRLQDLAAERDKLTLAGSGYRKDAPQVQAVDAQIASVKNEMKEIATQTLAAITDRREAAEKRVSALQAQVGGVPARSTSMARIQQRVDALQTTYDMLAGKYYEAQIAEAVEAGDVTVVDPAIPPELPDPSNDARNLILALLLGCALGVGLGFLVEHLDTRVGSPQDLEKAGLSNVLGVVPELQRADEQLYPLVFADGAQPQGAEAFRTLRTMVRFSRAQRIRVIAVSSQGPGEGKTIIASNLAAAFANEGSRVLLIDADLRRPTQHTVFDKQLEPGLTNILVGLNDFEAGIQNIGKNLDLMARGSAAPNPAELIGSDAFRSLLAAALDRYDLVLLDTAPLLAVTDSILLSAEVDGVIVVARAGRTDRRAVSAALAHLRQTGATVVGGILNGVTRKSGHGYGYGSYYYGSAYVYGSENTNGTNGKHKTGLLSRFKPKQRA